LVATSCVESGLNLSFMNGYRERCGLHPFLQTSGRVNRDNEYNSSCMYDFVLDDIAMSVNPQFGATASIFEDFFNSGKIHDKYCTEFVKEEIKRTNKKNKLLEIEGYEDSWNFYEMNRKFRVIGSMNKTIIVSDEIKNKIMSGEILYLTNRNLLRNSVRIRVDDQMRVKKEYSTFVDTISADDINANREAKDYVKQDIYVWTGPYDKDLYGYMKPFII